MDEALVNRALQQRSSSSRTEYSKDRVAHPVSGQLDMALSCLPRTSACQWGTRRRPGYLYPNQPGLTPAT